MKKKCDELLEVGYIYRNYSSKWACAPLIAPKEPSEKFRFTVDLLLLADYDSRCSTAAASRMETRTSALAVL